MMSYYREKGWESTRMAESKDTVVCPACHGTGRLDGGNCAPSYTCDVCGGSGRVPAPKEG